MSMRSMPSRLRPQHQLSGLELYHRLPLPFDLLAFYEVTGAPRAPQALLLVERQSGADARRRRRRRRPRPRKRALMPLPVTFSPLRLLPVLLPSPCIALSKPPPEESEGSRGGLLGGGGASGPEAIRPRMTEVSALV